MHEMFHLSFTHKPSIMVSVRVLLRKDKVNKENQHPIIIKVIHHRRKNNTSLAHYLSESE